MGVWGGVLGILRAEAPESELHGESWANSTQPQPGSAPIIPDNWPMLQVRKTEAER